MDHEKKIKNPSNEKSNTEQGIVEEGRRYKKSFKNTINIVMIGDSKSIGIIWSGLLPKVVM